jgi:V/A-type H+-transporting ATPase subunit A
MLKIIVDFHRLAEDIVTKGAPIFKVTELPILDEIMRMKTTIPNDQAAALDDLEKRMYESFDRLEASLR